MALDLLRRIVLMGLLVFIIGGLWLLAKWKAELSQPAMLFTNPLPSLSQVQPSGPQSDSTASSSFDQVLFEDDEVVRVS
ncbi:MAG TPA: hypothetical protein VH518_20125 [Tepidisphaeraceae bacterium]|jgi:hypothetical protein